MPILSWHVLTIGNISRNRFWGEDDSAARRGALCTSTLIRSGDTLVLIDPSEPPEAMARTLDRRAGITPADIDAVFVTHHHGDHLEGIEAFTNAKVYVPAGELDAVGIRSAIPVREGDEIAPGVRAVALPGHTPGLCGVIFQAAEGRIAVVGDAVMTRDFFIERAGYFNSIDFAACSSTHDRLQDIADVIVPGHDNYFSVAAAVSQRKS